MSATHLPPTEPPSPESITPKTQVLLISHDVVGSHMAGPGIRYYHMASVLAESCHVTLAIPEHSPSEQTPADFRTVRYKDWPDLARLLDENRVAIFPSDLAGNYPQLAETEAVLVVDGYDPLLAEWLSLSRDSYPLPAQINWWQDRMRQLTHQYQIGDFYICASERQRDWWLGLLEASGRINPYTFGDDPSLRSLIDVVPYGLPGSPPKWEQPVIKGVWPGISESDHVVLWGGGLWPWLDPLTAIRAVARIGQDRQDVKLIFPGTRHPNPQMSGMPNQNEAARALAQEYGVLDRFVFFGEWIPYADWSGALLECSVALSMHYETLETRLAFRSRIFDYIWAGLPIVTTEGDATGRLVEQFGLGRVVPYERDDLVAQAILGLLEKGDRMERQFEEARQVLNWHRAVEPLAAFCCNPRRAPDRQQPELVRHRQEDIPSQSVEILEQERDELRKIVAAYERGLFMRSMRAVHHLKRKILQMLQPRDS